MSENKTESQEKIPLSPERTEMRSEDSYYDNGWNDFIQGLPPKHNRYQDYRDGYNDCKDAKPEERKPI